ncbi:hypothetical protein Smar_1126 [Staphylothermus marinus F1]|uniref:Uncharacterized protein n=1 Tax=Staphylothermus marinus (strain ATCC 43588 / DSM 3639 / JCM 9404 / F1) TaxID=399550 RepID=A3DNL2_STAMF|nr:hypothetical protein [Staphylothermus marinus]ABN70222.1 hypothetical protein Smar_1126 [Staphylothermus marinus F1]
MYTRWVNPRKLDELVFKLRENNIFASRHSYSYRLLYNGKMIAGIHLYPGYKEVVLRIYMSNIEYAEPVLELIKNIIRKIFPDYKLNIHYIKPLIKE